MELDEKDRKLLFELQSNARMTNGELAEIVGLSTSGVQKRLRKLEENGFIARYATILDRHKLGFDLPCFVEVSLQAHEPRDVTDFDAAVQEMPEVVECYRLTGSADYLLKIMARNRDHLDHFLMKVLMPLKAVDRLRTRVIIKEIKETTDIPT
ncbi:MAG: Lrp/AsnC family transcriptional regulator [Anaerolineales bacterium]|nr:Lrp/AsnC family transcriptional regulator [Anaerolineales bacterium]MCA9932243.1 Lrp/AsnC family transcriptional regulator [Anaerolineales bacterium]